MKDEQVFGHCISFSGTLAASSDAASLVSRLICHSHLSEGGPCQISLLLPSKKTQCPTYFILLPYRPPDDLPQFYQ